MGKSRRNEKAQYGGVRILLVMERGFTHALVVRAMDDQDAQVATWNAGFRKALEKYMVPLTPTFRGFVEDAATVERLTQIVGEEIAERCHDWARTTPSRNIAAFAFCCNVGGPDNIVEISPGSWMNKEEVKGYIVGGWSNPMKGEPIP